MCSSLDQPRMPYSSEFMTSEQISNATTDAMVHHAEQLLMRLDAFDRTSQDHIDETPKRLVKMLKEMTEREEFNFTTFPSTSDEMVTLGPIPFYTLCAHHVVPFFGKAWIGYVPNDRVAGLSKFARAVKYVAKGLWVQEELVNALAEFLQEHLDPLGIAVVMDAEHMCMAMRGVEVAGVVTRTSSMKGVFADHTKTAKAEFMAGVK